jgi:CRP-like cAMP-binding protein
VRATFDVVAVLGASYLFEGLAREQLAPLAAAATVRRLGRGEVLFGTGDPADEICVVVEGEVKDDVINMDGEEVVHFVHGPGETLGEPGYFSVERNRIVEVRATRPAVVVVLRRTHLQPLLDSVPVLKDRALERLASNTRWQTTMISALATRPLPQRLLLRILELAGSSARNGTASVSTPEVTQSTLAAMVGASRENVNRALAALTAQGTLRKVGNRYVVPDEAQLREHLAQDWPLARMRDRRLDVE